MSVYSDYFNLGSKPFEIVPNPDYLYLSKSHKKAITYLDYGIREKAGFMVLTGEVGTGKTTLLKDLIKKIKSKVSISNIFSTKLNSKQLISMVNGDFGLDTGGKDKVRLLKDLYNYLIRQYSRGHRSVLLIDEAQNLALETLEEVRMLSNLETDRMKLLQIILVGQPELRKTLSMPDLRQLRQRINISCHINPLTIEETGEYIYYRLEKAGNRDAVNFMDGTLSIVHEFSRGIPRLINILCDFILLSAFVEKTKDISCELVEDVVDVLERDNSYWHDEAPLNAEQPGSSDANDILLRMERIENSLCTTNRLLSTYISRTHLNLKSIEEKISRIESLYKNAGDISSMADC